MALVYLPQERILFFSEPRAFAWIGQVLRTHAHSTVARIAFPDGIREVAGMQLSLGDAIEAFVLLQVRSRLWQAYVEKDPLPPAVRIWMTTTLLALSLVARHRVAPSMVQRRDKLEARWVAIWSVNSDREALTALAEAMPVGAHAVPVDESSTNEIWAPRSLLLAYVDAVIDHVLRDAVRPVRPRPSRSRNGASSQLPWNLRWQQALTRDDAALELQNFHERGVMEQVQRWAWATDKSGSQLRACFRLELPPPGSDEFTLRYFLQSLEDPSLTVAAEEVWNTRGRNLERFGRAFRDPQELLVGALGRAGRIFQPIGKTLSKSRPERATLTAPEAVAFLAEGGLSLSEAGFGVIVPGELTTTGQRRLRMRMRVGGFSKAAGIVSQQGELGFEQLTSVDWEAIIGDQSVSAEELTALAEQKSPLVQFRGEWVHIGAGELADVRKRLTTRSSKTTVKEAIRLSLTGQTFVGSVSVTVQAVGQLADMLKRLREGGAQEAKSPRLLQATLRPYQLRGLHWLSTMMSLGFGACLADDMGLGKTIQLLASLLRWLEDHPEEKRATLIVAPMSVIGNWEREIARFAPSLTVITYHGSDRAGVLDDLQNKRGTVVLTTYGLLRRDMEPLCAVDWLLVALDEAQNIKNAASATAKMARRLRASHRVALTGTPVENRLAELWSILDFVNPDLLGPLETFRREFAVPIERYGSEQTANRLRALTGPFILRRVKNDPAVIEDLPEKNEMKVICSLTREQASLYKALVDEEMRRIGQLDGIQRRGCVLALLTHTKQICNHPAHYLGESGPLPRRSGKLTRLAEMLDEVISSGDKALVFTQFREMGDKLVAHLRTLLGGEVLYLHGSTSKQARDEMVRRFQEEPNGPRIFVLSLKAGGTGLNLTAASHVFHYDRWWNPAVEDQATDRAYRIGQRQSVQVHKFLCAGTVEEKIDRLLEQKRDLAAKVVGAGENWITEMDTEQLRSLFELSSDSSIAMDEVSEGDEEIVALPKTAAKPRGQKMRMEIGP